MYMCAEGRREGVQTYPIVSFEHYTLARVSCRYDFNAPEDVPAELHHTFDCVVIDPPFITEEVWHKYAATAKLLLKPGGNSTLLPIEYIPHSMAESCALYPW